MLKQLGILDTVSGLASRRTKNTAPDSETAAVTATATAGEKGVAENDSNDAKEGGAVLGRAAPPTVSVVSKEQAMQLLKTGPHEQAAATRKRSRSISKGAAATATTTSTHEAGNDKGKLNSAVPPEAEAGKEDSSLEGKFVDLVDLLLPVPSKGEFDVNKIKSSLYFFS